MSTHTADRPSRVLIENADAAAAHAQAEALTAAGFTVTVCGGPSALPGGICPAVDGTGCALLDDADVVVHDLDLDDPAGRDVLARLRRSYPHLSVVVEATEDAGRRHGALLRGTHVIRPLDMDHLVDAVTEVAAGR